MRKREKRFPSRFSVKRMPGDTIVFLTPSYTNRFGKSKTISAKGIVRIEKLNEFESLLKIAHSTDNDETERKKSFNKAFKLIEAIPEKILNRPTNFELQLSEFLETLHQALTMRFKKESEDEIESNYKHLVMYWGDICNRGLDCNDCYKQINMEATLTRKPEETSLKLAVIAYWEARYLYRTRFTNIKARVNTAWATLILANKHLHQYIGKILQEESFYYLMEMRELTNSGRKQGGESTKKIFNQLQIIIVEYMKKLEPKKGWGNVYHTSYSIAVEIIKKEPEVAKKYDTDSLSNYIKNQINKVNSIVRAEFINLKVKHTE